jgi:transketolase
MQQAKLKGMISAKIGQLAMAKALGGLPEIILIASGSEASWIVQAHETQASRGIRSRIVSMPSWDIFEPQSYREEVVPTAVTTRIAVEQGSVLGWAQYVGPHGRVIGMRTFGASAPLKELDGDFGFEPEHVVAMAMESLGRN